MENKTIGSRIATLIEHFADGKNTQFAARIETNEANLRGYIQRGIIPKSDVVEKIVKNYDVDAHWLLTGEGSMLRSDTSNSVIPDSGSTIEKLVAQITDQAIEIGSLREQIGFLREQVRLLKQEKKENVSDTMTSDIVDAV